MAGDAGAWQLAAGVAAQAREGAVEGEVEEATAEAGRAVVGKMVATTWAHPAEANQAVAPVREQVQAAAGGSTSRHDSGDEPL